MLSVKQKSVIIWWLYATIIIQSFNCVPIEQEHPKLKNQPEEKKKLQIPFSIASYLSNLIFNTNVNRVVDEVFQSDFKKLVINQPEKHLTESDNRLVEELVKEDNQTIPLIEEKMEKRKMKVLHGSIAVSVSIKSKKSSNCPILFIFIFLNFSVTESERSV